MLLLLIRHAETEHNVAGILAGSTDSRLTAHGALQIQRLARYLVQQRRILFTHIFSSSLTRARLTADAILDAQTTDTSTDKVKAQRFVLEDLREQDFGSFECQPWSSKPSTRGSNGRIIHPGDPDFKAKESQESMVTRMDTFLKEYMLPILAADSGPGTAVAVVSHGIILSFLWRALLKQVGPRSVALGSGLSVLASSRPLEYLPAWSNTGYLELEIKPTSIPHDSNTPGSVDPELLEPALGGYEMLIKIVNGKDHLNNLKRTRGGLGSTAFDAKQKTLEGFFKKPKVDEHDRRPG